MRISTNNFYQLSSSQMTSLQDKIVQTSQQASTGKKVITPQDDPVGSAKLLEAKQAISLNNQYEVNRNALKYTIGLANVALNSVQDTMQSMNEQIISLGNGAITNSNRQAIALNLESYLDQLTSVTNAKDSAGHYLFSGYKSDTAPINASTYAYGGDNNNAVIQVDSSTKMGLGVNGGTIFSPGFLAQLKSSIAVLSNLSSSAADINTAVADLNTKFSLSQVTVNAAQVILGSNQNRLTTMDTIGSENNITNQGVVSSLEDVDYNKVLSDLSRQQLQLQVAQKTFQQISSLSIFNYIN